MPKIAEVKLSSCELEVADLKLWTSETTVIAELRLRSNISLKSCGIAIPDELPPSYRIAMADSKKRCACPPVATVTAI
jgi:hypothetical protein